jgi:hypothetical protein
MVYAQHTTVESSPVRPVLHFFLPSSQLLLWHPISSTVLPMKKKPHTLSIHYHHRTQLNLEGVQLLLSFNTMPRPLKLEVVEIGTVNKRMNAVSA